MKRMGKIIGFMAALAIFAGCSNLIESGKSAEEKFGSLTLAGSGEEVSKSLVHSELSVSSVKVYGYGIQAIVGTSSTLVNGGGTVTVQKIPVGRRVVEIVSNKSGAVLYAVCDIKSGKNAVSVDWSTTAVGKVYYELSKTQEISSVQPSDFSSAIDVAAHPSLIDASKIALDYKNGSLKSKENYILSTGTVVFTCYGFEGKAINIADPSSNSAQGVSDGSSFSITDVYPGTWNIYADGVFVKTVSVASGTNNVVIGNPLYAHTVIYVSAPSAPRIWIWQEAGGVTDGAVLMGTDWNGRPTMVPAVGMKNPDGWFMYDLTANSINYTPGVNFCIIVGDGPDKSTDMSSTFWYDHAGTVSSEKKIYSADPTQALLSNDAGLSSVSVNGNSISVSSSMTLDLPYASETATVAAAATDSLASVVVSPSSEQQIAAGGSKVFTITVTAQDGTQAVYSLTVNRAPLVVDDVSLLSLKVNGISAGANGLSYSFTKSGSADSLEISSVVATATDSAAQVTYSAIPSSVASGTPSTVKVTVQNGSKTAVYTLTITYTKQQGEENDYYWTNKNGCGVEKTISSFSDWDESMKIAQGAANDDPRAFRGYHEKATDFYALYAAYDDANLYLMVEMPSIDGRDITSTDWQYALDKNLGMGVGINTGKRPAGDGEMDTGITPWHADKFYSISEGIDTLLMFHPAEYAVPGFFVTKPDGKFSYDENYCLTFTAQGVATSKEVGLVSQNLYGRSDNYGLSMAEYVSKTDYVDMLADPEKEDVSGYKYQITISLAGLGIDKAYLKQTGISVMTFSTFGASMMDALPWCKNLVDNASKAYSKDDSTSQEKEDVDVYDVPLARIGRQ